MREAIDPIRTTTYNADITIRDFIDDFFESGLPVTGVFATSDDSQTKIFEFDIPFCVENKRNIANIAKGCREIGIGEKF